MNLSKLTTICVFLLSLSAVAHGQSADTPTVVNESQLVELHGKYYLGNSDRPYTGLIREFYANGLIKMERKVTNGALDPTFSEWYLNGEKKGDNDLKYGTPSPVTVTLLAGSWRKKGSADGFRKEARFSNLKGAAVDKNGVLYVLDGQKIRKISPDGMVSTVAGGERQGYRDGAGAQALFCHPSGITLDNAGNIYVADFYNHRIRKVTADGIVSTVAGEIYIFADQRRVRGSGCRGQRTRGGNVYPSGVAIDKSGNLFVASYVGHSIHKITPDGEATLVARKGPNGALSDGLGTEARFDKPTSISLDSDGNLFVADALNNRIRKIAPDGTVSTYAGSSYNLLEIVDKKGRRHLRTEGPRGDIQFDRPRTVTVAENGNVYVTEAGNRIRVIHPDADVRVLAGGAAGFANGPVAEAQFQTITDVVLDSAGNLIVADRNNHRIRKIALDGTVSTLAGSIGKEGVWYGKNAEGIQYGDANGPASVAQLFFPQRLAVDSSGNVFVVEPTRHRIRKITPDGMVSTFAGSGTKGFIDGPADIAAFNSPAGIAVDGEGNVYVADKGNHKIRMVSTDGIVSTIAGSTAGYADGPVGKALFNAPGDVAIRDDGVLFVADTNNNNIRQITTDGIVSTLAGSTRGYYNSLLSPWDLVVDGEGNIYSSNKDYHSVSKIMPDRESYEVYDFAGEIGKFGFKDGQGATARFKSLGELAIDENGNIFVADNGNRVIRKITPDGTVTSIRLSHNSQWVGKPNGLAVSVDGTVYVLDGPNQRIFKIEMNQSR